MNLPKYSELYSIILKTLADGRTYSKKELKEAVIQELELDVEAQRTLLASGRQTVLDSRVSWATTYLKKALLIHSPKRAYFNISPRGLNLLANVTVVTEQDLLAFSEFQEFKRRRTGKREALKQAEEMKAASPQEVIEQAYQDYTETLKEELLAEIYRMDPYRFEGLVRELLVKMGYGLPAETGSWKKASGDEGIDGVIYEDPLGFDSIYIQAKRYQADNKIGRPALQAFIGALAGHGAQKGLFITSSSFNKTALEFAAKNLSAKIVLIDPELFIDN